VLINVLTSLLIHLSSRLFCRIHISIYILVSFQLTFSLCPKLFIPFCHPCTTSSFSFPFPHSPYLSSFGHDSLNTPSSPISTGHSTFMQVTFVRRCQHHCSTYCINPINLTIIPNLTTTYTCLQSSHDHSLKKQHLQTSPTSYNHSNTQNGKLQCLLSLLPSQTMAPGL
jgi:hypothetical protein